MADIAALRGKESMTLNGKKTLYGITLDDYFSPSFCSSTKTYFGSLDEIQAFIESLEDTEQYLITKEAFKRYLEGDKEATHHVAYSEYRLLETVEVLAEEEIKLDKTAWEFLNVWRFPQYMEIDSGTVKKVLLKHGKTYLRTMKASVCGLRTADRPDAPKSEWLELCGGFWGHPGILKANENTVHSTLYMKEKEYKAKKEAIENFRTDPVSLDCMCEDVFGDG